MTRTHWVFLLAASCLGLNTSCSSSQTDDEIAHTSQAVTAWQVNQSYVVEQVVTYAGSRYRAQITHTSSTSWNPADAPSLWEWDGPDEPETAPGTPPPGLLSLDYVTLQTNCDRHAASCCPSDSTLETLTSGSDTAHVTNAAHECVLALAGNDTVQVGNDSGTKGSLVLGSGNDTAHDGADNDFIWGGLGNDTIQGHGGTNLFFGGWGDDRIHAANGTNTVVGGPGADNIALGTGDDIVYVFDECEIASGEVIDGGSGTNTLYAPFTQAELEAKGVVVSNVTVVVQHNACRSQCSQKPECPANAHCAEGAPPAGLMICACDAGWTGPNCDTPLASQNECNHAAPLPAVAAPSSYDSDDLWGFAELHSHPATQFGFGAQVDFDDVEVEEPGLFHSDDAACNPDTHSGFDLDPLRSVTRQVLLRKLDERAGHVHTPGSWPSAKSIVHEQMKVDWIERAYEGGLRLLFASVTDSQILDKLWNNGTNVFGNSTTPDPDWGDKERAAVQLQYMIDVADAHPTWMEIVTSSEEARETIEAGKLAIVLSLEMDDLSVDEILELQANYGVAHVIPIHLVNNDFGGTAIYNDEFNGMNRFLQNQTLTPVASSTVSFRLNPQVPSLLALPAGGLTIGEDGPPQLYPACSSGGHINSLGLEDNEAIRRLMKAGLLVDVAHMSEKSMREVLDIAEGLDPVMPVMNSHTGLRSGEEISPEADLVSAGVVSERDLAIADARRIAATGGVMGLGTSGELIRRPLATLYGGELVRIGGGDVEDVPSFSWGLVDRNVHEPSTPVHGLRLSIRTGADDKRSCNEYDAFVKLRDGSTKTWSNVSEGTRYPEHSHREESLTFDDPVELADIVRFGIDFNSTEHCSGTSADDTWLIVDLRVEWQGATTTSHGPLLQKTATVFSHPDSTESDDHRGHFLRLVKDTSIEAIRLGLENQNQQWFEDLRWSRDSIQSETIDRLTVTLVTGEDDYDPEGNEATRNAKIHLQLNERRNATCGKLSLDLGDHFDARVSHLSTFDLSGMGVRVQDIQRVWIETSSNCGNPSAPGLADAAFFGATTLPNIVVTLASGPIGTALAYLAGPLLTFLGIDNAGGGCLGQDNWDIALADVQVRRVGETQTERLAIHRGRPWFRTTGQRRVVPLYEGRPACDDLTLDTPAEFLEVTIKTGKDDLKTDSQPSLFVFRKDAAVVAGVRVPSGVVQLNPDTSLWSSGAITFLRNESVVKVIVKMPAGTTVGDLDDFGLYGGVGNDDDWDIDTIAISVLADPVTEWNRHYRVALAAMGGRGVALGTDLNGFEHQIPFSSISLSYPFQVHGAQGGLQDTLDRSTSGSKTFDMSSDGIAHFGMLADFVETVQNVPETGTDSHNRLFRTAEDTVRMWERVEVAAAAMP